jgi:hypothetical protein
MTPSADSPERRIALFQRKEVRRTIHDNEWWFVITDVITALTDSANPSDYLKKLRKRDPLLGDAFKGGGQLVPPLALSFETPGGIQRLQCWNTEGLFRLIQSIPSPKAEPFKRWLAKVGYERIQEHRSPWGLGVDDLKVTRRARRAGASESNTRTRIRHPHCRHLPGRLRPHSRRIRAPQETRPPESPRQAARELKKGNRISL